MGALLALLGPLALALIPQLQAAFHHVATPAAGAPATPEPDIGAAKMDVLMQAARAAIQKLVTINAPLPNGVLPSTIPITDDALRGFLEGQFQSIKATGGLTPSAPTGDLFLVRGSVTAVK